jgi:hypothetical protein
MRQWNKKLSSVGDILVSLNCWQFQKCRWFPVEPYVSPTDSKKEPCWIVDCQPYFSEIAPLDGHLDKVGILEFSFQGINNLGGFRCMELMGICNFRTPNFLFYLSFVKSWGCGNFCPHSSMAYTENGERGLACSERVSHMWRSTGSSSVYMLYGTAPSATSYIPCCPQWLSAVRPGKT